MRSLFTRAGEGNEPMQTRASTGLLRALASHLETVSQSSRAHGGTGWTYDDEVKDLRRAAAELEAMRKTAAHYATLDALTTAQQSVAEAALKFDYTPAA